MSLTEDEAEKVAATIIRAMADAHKAGLGMYLVCDAFMAGMEAIYPDHNVSLNVNLRRQKKPKAPKAPKAVRS